MVETGEKLLPVEVKATSQPRVADAAGVRAFRREYGRTARAGVLLHTASRVEWLTDDVLAVAWWMVC